MISTPFSQKELSQEVDRIREFIREQSGNSKLIIGLSGGIDSEVIARLCLPVVGVKRIKCFTVIQADFDSKHLNNARKLAEELEFELVEIPFQSVPYELIKIMAKADPKIGFLPEGLLDVARSKCAIRTFIFSAYAERGYLVVGPSNRTELELGYFLPFGDGLAHFSPIAHLYKTQVQQLAKELGTSDAVIKQPPSAGFWVGDEDLDGIAYWLFNEGPIQVELELSDSEESLVRGIYKELSFSSIDLSLLMISQGTPLDEISKKSGLTLPTLKRLVNVTENAKKYKRRQLGTKLPILID